MTTSTGGFSLGISAEQQLAMPLDAIIQQAQKKTKGGAGKPAKRGKVPAGGKLKQQSVKKTVVVPISKAARARVHSAVASSKRQAVINKRRPGLVVAKSMKRPAPVVQVRRQAAASAMRVTRSMAQHGKHPRRATSGGLDVSNIINHFRTHPKKFDVPKGSNLRITINLHNVKPVVGAKK